jgi:RNA polymerase sigma-70 factor, ECF subfamily
MTTPSPDASSKSRESASASPAGVTALLRSWGQGDRAALDALLPVVYDELRRRARRQMRAQPSGHTLQTTAIIHEAYLRLVGQQETDWQSRAHFFGVAAKAMRSVLVDHARAQRAAKRGGGAAQVTLADVDAVAPEPAVDVLALEEALTRLATFDPRKGQLVELRYFGGLGIEETAVVLGVSSATVKREWVLARAWLRRELEAM